MAYQHPLAYLLGLEGLALLRAWVGDEGLDRAFVEARLAEVRRLLDAPELAGHDGVEVHRGDTVSAYRAWSSTYDEPNSLFVVDEPVLRSILEPLPAGVALDAACGTGRLSSMAAELGHSVIGVDSSPEMLERAVLRLPAGDFRVGDLHALPVDDGSVDLVISGLALAHVPALGPVFAEFARVLRPGGHLVISDTHHEIIFRGSIVKSPGPSGSPGLVATYRHGAGDFLRAALPVGFQVLRCEEPARSAGDARSFGGEAGSTPPPITVGPWESWPWSLLELIPAAAGAAWDVPPVIVWHFQLEAADG